MARDLTDTTPITARHELVAHIEAGSKPRSAWRIGTEHEKFPFYLKDMSPVPYGGAHGIRAVLEGMGAMLGWDPIVERDAIIGLVDVTGGGAISLEPGGQFELSGAPLHTIHQTNAEIHAHLAQLREVAEPLGIAFLGLGMSPLWSLADTPVMPKARYGIMTNYMPKVGALGRDMMYRTCTVQVNLDYASEADMVKKLRVSVALQPIATALFANSPFTGGRLNGFKTLRAEIWRHTDPDRTGMIPFVFDDGMGFEAWVDYALDVPLYFVKRGDTYHDVAGRSFRDLMEGRVPELPGVTATLSDWSNHLTTLFPEVRVKRYLEMRGADAGPTRRLNALPAFWVGLLYDQSALDGAWDLVKDWTAPEREALRAAVPKLGLEAPFRRTSVRELARQVLALSRAGLEARGRRDVAGRSEARFIDDLDVIVEKGRTAADELIERYTSDWGGSVLPVFESNAY